jgi:hypothetical protein
MSTLYGGWDVVVLIAAGGRYATSERVYEAFASGLPVLSAHEVDHDASHALAGSPLWTGAVGPDVELLAKSFRKAARLAVTATPEDRAAARAAAAGFAGAAQLEPAIRRVTAAVRPGHSA